MEITAVKLIIIGILLGNPVFATHKFNDVYACLSFGHWFVKEHPGLKFSCVPDKGWEI